MGINRIDKLLFQNVSIAPLVIFRIIFGSLILFGTIRFLSYGWVDSLYIQPDFYFTYYGFDWVHPLSGNWMYLPFILLMLSSINVIIGFLYRFSSVVLFLSFTYIELLDKTNYLNHYYFVSLMAFILCWLPANKNFSLDVKWKITHSIAKIPIYTIRLIQFQLAIVYFFAGIAKLNSDWLFRAEPLRSWLNGFDNLPVIGNLLAQRWTAFAFSWIGCIYDLTIVFLLLYRKTRSVAYFLVVVFHLLTWILFPIGVFPWVMIFSTLIFFSASFHQRILDFLKAIFNYSKTAKEFVMTTTQKKMVVAFLSVYVFFQMIVPLRSWFYPGNLFWTEEGFRFSWRVMLMQKTGSSTFYLVDKATQRKLEVNNLDFITKRQEAQMCTQPDMIIQYAHYLHHIFQDTVFVFGDTSFHLVNPAIKASIDVSLNGRTNQPFVLPNIDLAKLSYNLKHRNWIEKWTIE